MKKSEKYTVQSEIADFFIKALYITIFIVDLTLFIVMPINLKARPELYNSFLLVSGIVLFVSILSIFFGQLVKRSQLLPGTKLLLYSTLLSVLFCSIAITSVKLNELLWATLIINVMLSIFLIKIKHIFFNQLLSYASLVYLITFGGLSHLMLTQKITIVFFLSVGSTIAMAARNTIFLVIDKLIEKSSLLKTANMDMQILNNELEIIVEERTRKIQSQKEKLEKAMLKLEDAQESMISNKNMESYLSITRGISHQMNTPLGIILTTTSYLKGELKQLQQLVDKNELTKNQLLTAIEKFTGCEKLINDNVETSIEIVGALKRYSGTESNKEEHLLDVIRNFKTYFVKNVLNKSIVINIIAPKTLEFLVPEYTFVQVLELILENSVDFSTENVVNINIEVTNEMGKLELIISDDGPGIDDQTLDQIFNPYFSTNPHRLGMGLFIVENFITYTLKGKIEVYNGVKRGTVVKITL